METFGDNFCTKALSCALSPGYYYSVGFSLVGVKEENVNRTELSISRARRDSFLMKEKHPEDKGGIRSTAPVD